MLLLRTPLLLERKCDDSDDSDDLDDDSDDSDDSDTVLAPAG